MESLPEETGLEKLPDKTLHCLARIIQDLKEFKEMSDVIVSNRYAADLADVKDKVYTRDLYMRD